MSKISEWMKEKSHSLAEETGGYSMQNHLLANTISGFGMKGRVIRSAGRAKERAFPKPL